jgi:glycolate oxidase FAD binding subunit
MPVTDRFRLSELERFGFARQPDAGDQLDGVWPGAILEPDTAQNVAAALAWASSERLTTVIRGGGSKLAWGRPPGSIDIVLSTSRLKGALIHRHGDLTATLQAGERLLDINGQLAREKQWLPIDTAFDSATIGGIVATNDSGPLRSHYGTPRDLVIGITLAMTDGRLVKSGGHVVKNVAGYDLGKLMSGSFGSLAAIVDVTVKLSPITAASRTLVARFQNAAAVSDAAVAISSSQLEPVAFDLQLHVGSEGDVQRALLVRFATSPEAVNAQVDAARALLSTRAESIAEPDEQAAWVDQIRRPWSESGTTIRLAWLPAMLPQVLAVVDEVRRTSGAALDLHGRVITGAGVLRIDAEDDAVERAVAVLRSRADVVSNVVVLRQSIQLKSRVDAWGPDPSAALVLRALKRSFDPAGILNAGRGPI